jgi:hypothetical protein
MPERSPGHPPQGGRGIDKSVMKTICGV